MGKTTLGGTASKVTAGAKDAAAATKQKLAEAMPGEPAELHGPSPNPHTNLLIADVALRGSSMLMRRAVEQGLLGSKYPTRKARAILQGRSWSQTLLHSAIARVAVRSVPGALLVGGGLIAKTLYDRSRSNVARAKGEIALHEMAEDGSE